MPTEHNNNTSIVEFKSKNFTALERKAIKSLIETIATEWEDNIYITKSLGIAGRHREAHTIASVNRLKDNIYTKFVINIDLTDTEKKWFYKLLYDRFKSDVLTFSIWVSDPNKNNNMLDINISNITMFANIISKLGITYDEYDNHNEVITSKEIAAIWNDVCDEHNATEDKIDIDNVNERPKDPLVYINKLLKEMHTKG